MWKWLELTTQPICAVANYFVESESKIARMPIAGLCEAFPMPCSLQATSAAYRCMAIVSMEPVIPARKMARLFGAYDNSSEPSAEPHAVQVSV